MRVNPNRTAIAAALSLTTLLTACGGGGGGSTSTTSSTGSTTSTASAGAAATPQYATGSQELAAFTQLNSMRQQCGFPAVSENTLLDTAAANHYQYMVDNQVTGHYETQGNPGFTGVTPQNRATVVGYSYGAGEANGSYTGGSGGALAIIGLASLPYHSAGIFSSFAEVGMKYGTFAGGLDAFEMMTGSGATTHVLQGSPITFPCQGTSGVDYEGASIENPTPTINGTAFSQWGTPIAVIGNTGDTVTLTSGTLIDPNNNSIALNLLDSANDSNHELPTYVASAFPSVPLKPNTTYMATLAGTDNGVTFTRQFSFTTGSQGQF